MNHKRLYKGMAALLAAALLWPGLQLAPKDTKVHAQPAITQIPGTVHSESELNKSFLSVSGFAKGKVKDRSNYAEGDKEYAAVTNEAEFLAAVKAAQNGEVHVIEIRSDLYLGWNELSDEAKEASGGMLHAYRDSENMSGTPVANPLLIESGVSCLNMTNIDGLTIFSKDGCSINHAEWRLNSGCKDIVIRNLSFQDVWEWDDHRLSGFGSTGGKGDNCRVGWAYIRINSAKDIWIDHCDFAISYDGDIDVENGSSGVSITWCRFGDTDISVGSVLDRTLTYMEDIYQDSKKDSSISSFVAYKAMRDGGMTREQISWYIGYLRENHMCGAGDKDTWLYKDEDGTVKVNYDKTDANESIRVALGYNYYESVGQRIPLLRGGAGMVYNCYVDDEKLCAVGELMKQDLNNSGKTISERFAEAGYPVRVFARAINARNGASVAADTCVFNYVNQPLIYSELDDYTGTNFDGLFGKNYTLIVNSRITNNGIDYTGSSWDNDGDNPFTDGVKWHDRSTIGAENWSWGWEGKENENRLSFAYQTFPLEKVQDYTVNYGGAGSIALTAEEWLKIDGYSKDGEILLVDKEKEVPAETFQLSESKKKIYLGEYFQLSERITPVNHTVKGEDITWKSSDETVAKVSNAGLVKPLKAGKATITATLKDGKQAVCEIEVEEIPESVTVTNEIETLFVGDLYYYQTKTAPEHASQAVVWSSGSQYIHVPDAEKGIIQALKASSSAKSLQVTANETGNRLGTKAANGKTKVSKIIEPKVPVTGIAINTRAIEVQIGSSAAITANVLPAQADNQKIYWFSSDETVATVDENGVVKGIATGSAVITAKSMNYGYETTCEAVVTKAFTPAGPQQGYKPGDVNNDGKITLADAQLTLRKALHLTELGEEADAAADVDGDGRITLNDARFILRYALHLIDAF